MRAAAGDIAAITCRVPLLRSSSRIFANEAPAEESMPVTPEKSKMISGAAFANQRRHPFEQRIGRAEEQVAGQPEHLHLAAVFQQKGAFVARADQR